MANRLRELRRAKNMTLDEIAKDLGISKQSYSAYELETRNMNQDVLLKMSDYFNVTIDYLLYRTNDRTVELHDTANGMMSVKKGVLTTEDESVSEILKLAENLLILEKQLDDFKDVMFETLKKSDPNITYDDLDKYFKPTSFSSIGKDGTELKIIYPDPYGDTEDQ